MNENKDSLANIEGFKLPPQIEALGELMEPEESEMQEGPILKNCTCLSDLTREIFEDALQIYLMNAELFKVSPTMQERIQEVRNSVVRTPKCP